MDFSLIKIKHLHSDNDYSIIKTTGPGVIDSWNTRMSSVNILEQLDFFYTIGRNAFKASVCWTIKTESGNVLISPVYDGNNKKAAITYNNKFYVADIQFGSEYKVFNVEERGELLHLNHDTILHSTPYLMGYKSIDVQDNPSGDMYFLAFANNLGLLNISSGDVGRFWFTDDEGIHRGFYCSNSNADYIYHKNQILKCVGDYYDGIVHFIRPEVIYDRGSYSPTGLNTTNNDTIS